jgi:sulfite reductase beta subunit-like hemoprotein
VGYDARVGDRLDGRIPEEDTPKVIAAIAKHYVATRAEGETFRDFVSRVGAVEVGKAGFAVVDSVI